MIILTQIPLKKKKYESLKTSLTQPSIKQAVSLRMISDHAASTIYLTHTTPCHVTNFVWYCLPSLNKCKVLREVRSWLVCQNLESQYMWRRDG